MELESARFLLVKQCEVIVLDLYFTDVETETYRGYLSHVKSW